MLDIRIGLAYDPLKLPASRRYPLLPPAMLIWVAVVCFSWVATVSAYIDGMPMVVDLVPVARPNAINTPNYVEISSNGDPKMFLASGVPGPNPQLFLTTMYLNWKRWNDMRVFTSAGVPVLNFTSGGAGVQVGFIKNLAGVPCVVSAVHWSLVELPYLNVQPISILGGIYAISGTNLTRKDRRVPRILDDTGTVYFFGAGLDVVVKYSAVDLTTAGQTVSLVPPNDYTKFAFRVQVFNSILVWFWQFNTLSIIDRSNLGSVLKWNMTDIVGTRTIQNQLDEKILWNIQRVSSSPENLLQRRRVTGNSTGLETLRTSASNLPILDCYLVQIASVSLILIVPQHSNPSTQLIYRGMVFFANDINLEIYSYTTPQNWLVMSAADGVQNPATEEGGRRSYLLFADTVTLNIHSYYFLLDTCMSSTDFSNACMACPAGFWRASVSLPVPRRCLVAAKFPPKTGMNNATLTFEPCSVTNCASCTYDYQKCQSCDYSNGFYLYSDGINGFCLDKPHFPAYHGINTTSNRVVPCEDEYCLNCFTDFEVCIKCDTTRDAYLLRDYCLLKSQMGSLQGPDLATGTVQPCLSPGCIQCNNDRLICENCYVQQRWYLLQSTSTCLSINQFAPNQGPHLVQGTVTQCTDTACMNCKFDHEYCLECNSLEMFAYLGKCNEFGGDLAPKMLYQRFYSQNMSLQVWFEDPIKLVYNTSFFTEFLVTVQDTLESKTYSCGTESLNSSYVACELGLYERGYSISFETNVKIFSGSVSVYPNRDKSAKSQGLILDRASNRAFKEFPLVIDGFTSDRPKSLAVVTSIVKTTKNVNSYLSILIAALSLSVSVIFDRYMVTLEYLSLLEGPLLVYPQQIFDMAEQLSNFLPEQFVAGANKLNLFRDLSGCRPSYAFLRQQYECSVIGNMGPDTLVVVILAVLCLSITVVCNKIIDMRIKSLPKNADNEMDPKKDDQKERERAKTMHKSNSSSSVAFASKTLTKSTVLSPYYTKSILLSNSFLPSGKIDSTKPEIATPFNSFCANLREIYGLSFFLVKLEANQLILFLVIFLNYWNYNQGNLEQYSLIAAIIFTLYYIFQGYFTYQFAAKIWQEVQQKKLGLSVIGNFSEGPGNNFSESGTRTISESQTNTNSLKTFLPELLAGPNKDIRANLYEEVKVPATFLQLCGPFIGLIRSVTVAAILVLLSSVPSVQVIFAIIVEIAYLVFIIKGPKLAGITQFCLALWSQVLVMAFMVLKAITIMADISEYVKQRTLGFWMAWILAVYGLTAGIVFFFEVWEMLYTKLKSCRKRKWRAAPDARSKTLKSCEEEVPGTSDRNRVLTPSDQFEQTEPVSCKTPNLRKLRSTVKGNWPNKVSTMTTIKISSTSKPLQSATVLK